MNKEETIKKILALNFKEYSTNNILESYERAWQKKISESLFINIRLWEHSKDDKNMKDAFDIKIYFDRDELGAEQILIFSFNDFDLAYKRVLEYIKFLTK